MRQETIEYDTMGVPLETGVLFSTWNNDNNTGAAELMNQTNFENKNGQVRGRSRRKGSPQSTGQKSGGGWKAALTAGCLILGLAAAGSIFYTYQGQRYQQVYFPKTVINGMNASGRTPEEVKEMIVSQIKGYSLTLETRQQTEEVLRGLEIGLHPEYDGTLEQILEAQSPMLWGISALRNKEYVIETMVAYDHELLESAIDKMEFMNPENVQEPVDAHISEYIAGTGYQIVPETQGTLIRRDMVMQGVTDALLSLQDRLNLEEIGAYEAPKLTADAPELQERLAAWNQYANITVTYQFGSSREVVDGAVIHPWLSDNGQNGVSLDEEQVAQFVKELARKYNTAYQPKTLETSYGKTVTITGGPYGWRINQAAETAELTEILRSGESQTREPIYSQRANSHEGPDYGDTYVEINLTAQHLFFYKDGKLLAESDFVSGNESRGWGTPAGAFPLTYKERNATLRGENYATPVSYWMPFNGNIGMHDADWRDSFGGTIYKTSGSHGCVNLPPAVAKKIYENIEAGMPVLCYNLSGTGSSSVSKPGTEGTKPTETTAVQSTETTSGSAQTESPAAPAESPAAPTETTAARPAETAPAETKPSVSTRPSESAPAGATTPSQPSETPGGGAQPTPGGTAQPTPGGTSQPTPGGTSQPTSGGTSQPTLGGTSQPTPGGTAQPTPGGTAQPGSSSSGAVTSPGAGNSGESVSGPGSEESKSSSGVVSGPGQ